MVILVGDRVISYSLVESLDKETNLKAQGPLGLVHSSRWLVPATLWAVHTVWRHPKELTDELLRAGGQMEAFAVLPNGVHGLTAQHVLSVTLPTTSLLAC